ncbi:diacylglycerol kinase catalytic domain-containing protein [Megalodesulfovibrio paquesii]
MNTPPTILLYNPVSGHGHADSWLALFARALLEAGFRVQVLTPGREAFVRRMGAQAGHAGLEVLPWEESLLATPPAKGLTGRLTRRLTRRLTGRRTGQLSNRLAEQLAEQLARYWDRIAFAVDRYVRRTEDSRITPGMPWRRRVKKRLLQSLLPPLRPVLARLPLSGWPGLRWADVATLPEDDTNHWFQDPEALARHLEAALHTAPSPPDLVFHMFLDKLRHAPRRWQAFARRISRISQTPRASLPWAGIRFLPPPPSPPEAFYALDSMRGTCLLDAALTRDYAAAMPHKCFAALPDITFAELPDHEPELAATIRARARGRRIVFLGGAIRSQKNILRWEELIHRADPARWFFVMVGEICRDALDGDELQAADRLLLQPPEHLFVRPGYLEDEREFNALIALTDVIFAAYNQFPYSSNMLGKAAQFGKPLLAAKGYLLGNRVERFGIGRTVAEDDSAAMLSALEHMAVSPVPEEQFSACRDALSASRLSDVLQSFIHQCLRCEG